MRRSAATARLIVPIDAIPNVGENQVIVFTEWPGRSPKDVEDQVTYPLSVALLTVPHAESVRGKSMFGYSFVQVTFADGTDFYWARSRVLERLGTAIASLPEGVTPTLGPDATALGQIFYYVLEGPPEMNLAELRTLQDYVVKYELQSVQGVSEVASVGGYVRQYQIEVDPDALRFHDVPLERLIAAVKDSNIDVGAKTVESGGMEYVIRGRGFIGQNKDTEQALADIEKTVVLSRDGVPVRIRDLGQVQLGPDFRSGAIDLNGTEAVGGVVVMRFGENPREVIERVREKIEQIEPSLKGVKVVPIYDRTGLINETVATLTESLREELRHHGRRHRAVPAARPGQPDRGRHAADGRADVVHRHAVVSDRRQHHVAGRDRDCHRRSGGPGNHHFREHLSAPGGMGSQSDRQRTGSRWSVASARHAQPHGRDHRCDARSGSRRDDRRLHDDCQLSAGVLSDGSRLQALCAAGLDQDVRDVRGAAGRRLPGSGALPAAAAQLALAAVAGTGRRRRGGQSAGVLASILFWHPWVDEVSPLPLWATAPVVGTARGRAWPS